MSPTSYQTAPPRGVLLTLAPRFPPSGWAPGQGTGTPAKPAPSGTPAKPAPSATPPAAVVVVPALAVVVVEPALGVVVDVVPVFEALDCVAALLGAAGGCSPGR